MALSSWESLENAMTILFSGITGMPFFIAIQIYGSLPSSASKHNMIRAAGRARFNGAKEYFAFFKAIMDVTDDFLARRNDIAHGFVTAGRKGHHLTPPYHIGKNFDYILREEKYAFNSKDIERFAENFGHLFMEMMEASSLLCFPYAPRIAQETPLTRYLQPSLDILRHRRILGSEPPTLESFER
jgi:hypothetical protein